VSVNARRAVALTALIVLAVVGCGDAATAPTPSLSPIPSPTPAAELSLAQVRYVLIDRFGPLTYCDPDQFPIPHGDEQEKADARLSDIRADGPTFEAILDRLGLTADDDFDEGARLAIYREWKQLNAVHVEPLGEGRYSFDLVTETDPGMGRGVRSAGTIDSHGRIDAQLQAETFLTGCPICLAHGTLIDTPSGPVAVETLRAGDLVWTVDSAGRRVPSRLLLAASTPAPADHQVVQLRLGDGRELWVSPGHALADGRLAGDLAMGDHLDGSLVMTAELADYTGRSTFDILPGGTTGFYWANGILLASTLR